MKKLFAVLVFALFAFPAAASALTFNALGYDWRPYFGLGMQASIASVAVDVPAPGWELKRASAIGGIFDFAVGAQHERVRLEANYFARASLNDTISWIFLGVASASSESGVLFHFYYDWVKAGIFSMYIGGGLGVSSWSQSTSYLYITQRTYQRSGTDLVWNILTGMSFTIADAFSIDTGIGWQQTQGIDFRGFNFKLGIRYTL